MSARQFILRGSRVKKLMDGDLPSLYREITTGTQEDDVRYPLHVAFGLALEPLHREWFSSQTGINLTDFERRYQHSSLPLAVTLDATITMTRSRLMRGHPDATSDDLADDTTLLTLPWEGKTTGQGKKPEHMVDREYPQLQAQMMTFPSEYVILSIMWRTPKWAAFVVQQDRATQADIADRLDILQYAVDRGVEPSVLPPAMWATPTFWPLVTTR